jgi:hypothetical protein
MSYKRLVLLAAGAVLAASLMSNAASPVSAISSDKPEKPACSDPNEVSDKMASSHAAPAASGKPACKDADEASPASATSLVPSASPSPHSEIPAVNTQKAAEVNPAARTPESAVFPAFSTLPVKPIQSPGSDHDHDHDGNKHDQPNTVITPTGLAMTDTVLSYCAEVDRNAGDTYEAGVKMITQGHSDSEVASVRKTPEYARTRDTIKAQLSKVSFGTGLLACRQFSGAPHKPYGITTPIRTKQFGSD